MLDGVKLCPDCGQTLPRSEFGTRVAGSGNVVSASKCRPCARGAARAAYDPARGAESYRRRRAEDPDRFRLYGRKQMARLLGKPERAERARAWREANPDRVREYQQQYALENRAAKAAWTRGRNARQAGLSVVPFSKEQLLERLSMFSGCWMCGGPKQAIDHVKPLAAGGAHMLSNLRPACTSCNSRKRAKWPIDTSVRNVRHSTAH